VGVALRSALALAARPALLGYPDSYYYMGSADGRLFGDTLHPAGYALFLRALHAIYPHLSAAVITQHVLGLGTAVLLFVAVRRAGLSGWWSLLPAAVVLLGGGQVFLEHAPMTEPLFVLLQTGAMYAAIRALDGRKQAWAALAGALAGLAVPIRPVGLLLVAAVVLWLLVVQPGGLLRQLACPGAAALAAAVTVGGYVVVQHERTGFTGLVQAGDWYLYSRTAVFADCRKFKPPAGTARLCERTPASRRPGPNHYINAGPAVRAFGHPYFAPRSANSKLAAFARAAIAHQPLDWLDQVVTEELPRYVSSGRVVRGDQGTDYGLLAGALSAPANADMRARVARYYSGDSPRVRRRLLDALRTYERRTRVDGPVAVLLMLLSVCGVLLAEGRQRVAAILFVLVAFGGMIGSAASFFYDARYAIVAWGPLAAAAAMGASALVGRWQARRARTGEHSS
jgi:hypothetical protein